MFFNDASHWKIGISGHACYDNTGHDIVCAGVSLLATMIAQCLIDEEIRGTSKMELGEAYFEFDTKNKSWVDSKMMMIFTGFQLIANQYPQNVVMTSFFSEA